MFKNASSKNDTGLRLTKAQVVLSDVRETFIPEAGSFLYEKDTKNLYLGDGVTPGGCLYSSNINKEMILELFNDNPEIIQQISNVINNSLDLENIDLGEWT